MSQNEKRKIFKKIQKRINIYFTMIITIIIIIIKKDNFSENSKRHEIFDNSKGSVRYSNFPDQWVLHRGFRCIVLRLY